MKKSRLINIFKSLTKKEIRDLRKWLHSPAHNQREDTVLLFEYLVADDNLQQEDLLDKSTVFKHLMRDEKEFDDAKIRQVMYFLMKSVEEFLIYQEFMTQKSEQNLLLARALRKRKNSKYFQKSIKDTLTDLQKEVLRDKDFYRYDYEIKHEKYEFQSRVSRTIDFNLQEMSDSLDVYYLSLKIRQCCMMVSHQRVFKTEYTIGLSDEILKYIETKKLHSIPAIGIYYFGYKSMVDEEGDDSFKLLKNNLFEYENLFPKDEFAAIYLIAINYCIGKMNTGVGEFRKEAFELYKRGFENKILLTEDSLSHYTFINVISIALSIEEYQWTEDFIHSHAVYLKNEYRETTVLYCQARLEYDKDNFKAAKRLFIRVEHADVLLNLSAKNFLLKMYFEESEISVLEALLESMSIYIRRKKLVGYYRENYKNIIKFTKKLVRVNPFSKKDKEKLKNEIEQVSPLTEKKWLLEQLTKV